MSWQQRWLDRYYDRSKGWVGGTERFQRMIAEGIRPQAEILEIGAGPTNEMSNFLADLGPLHGVDPDPDVANNTALTSWKLLDGDRIDYPDSSFDVCVSNYVVEHVADAQRHLGEVRRVLRPGGSYLFRTPNLWHYVSMISRWTPHRFHLLVANRMRHMDEESHDPYPTHYVLNTRRAIREQAAAAGLALSKLEMIEPEPMYGLHNRLAFLLFMGYERVVNSSDLFSGFRVNILGKLVRPAAGGEV